jgi:hypothetical protein
MSNVPDWIKNYPHEMDRTALTSLAEASKGDFDKPREMNFSLYDFSKEDDLQAAAKEAHDHGWTCQAFQQSDDASKFVLEAQKEGYVVTQENYERDAKFFMKLAETHGAQYDGWFASS